MASCCIPVIDQPCVIDGVPYFDGGLADPVPLNGLRPRLRPGGFLS
ncbi:MAG: hypothetical protein ACLVJH_10485 [Faecalibacterium prausnitzii]